ncbi:hypothetical protein D5F11_021655 [Siminovitchia terrae]|uniref:Uncharacterized protein n=1 Tax=Siminovitchia terrae TaxID=1914933 RepID=A0A429X2S8_SIMTE|nr:hypothetical protein [Siminovitchia terrae]RST57669.1 hypothetical protein D5F11_021655 [Siminovitchia terrae]
MSEQEKYFYIFEFVNGKIIEIERDDIVLAGKLRSTDKRMFPIDNMFINLDNVISITVETQSERESDAEEILNLVHDIKF